MEDTDRIPPHLRLVPAPPLRAARFTPAMGEELEFYFQRADGAMGERSGYGAFVDTCMAGVNKGGLVGDHSAMISRLGAVAKAKRIRETLDKLSRKARKVLEGKYDVGGSPARVASELVPGLTHPGVAYALEGPAKLRKLAERLRTPDKGDENQRARAKAVRDEARAYLRSTDRDSPGLNERCAQAIREAEASYATFRAYLPPNVPKRASLEAQDAMRELDESMGPPLNVEPPKVRYELEPVYVRPPVPVDDDGVFVQDDEDADDDDTEVAG